MSDNRIIFKFRKINGLTDSELEKVENGEHFINGEDNQLYLKGDNGIVISVSGTAGLYPDSVTHDSTNYVCTFNNGDPNTMITSLPLRLVMRIISPDNSVGNDGIDINGTVYELGNNSGLPLEKDEIIKGQILDIIYDGKKFRVINSLSKIPVDSEGNIVINGNPIINGSPVINGTMIFKTLKAGEHDEFVVDKDGNIILHNNGIKFKDSDGKDREEKTQIGNDAYIDGKLIVNGGIEGITVDDLPELHWNEEIPINIPDELMPPISDSKSIKAVNAKWVRNLIRKGGGLPVGTVVMFDRKPLPVGFLSLDGSTFDRDLYPELFRYLGSNILPDYTDLVSVVAGRKFSGGEIVQGVDGSNGDGTFTTQVPDGVITTGSDGKLSPFTVRVKPDISGSKTTLDGLEIKSNNSSGSGKGSVSSVGMYYAIKAGDSIINDSNINVENILGIVENTYNKQDMDKKMDALDQRMKDFEQDKFYTDRIKKLEELLNSTTAIGEIAFKPFDTYNIGKGWYKASGDRFKLDSFEGKVLNALPDSYKRDMHITVESDTINLPNMFHSDGRGYFVRAGLKAGEIQEDTQQKISGSIMSRVMSDGRINFEGYNLDNYTMKLGVFETGSTHYKSSSTPFGNGVVTTDGKGTATEVSIDSSRQVRTSNENRPLNISLIPYVYLGVEDN